jgi:hypothetical protein
VPKRHLLPSDPAERLHRIVLLVLQVAMGIEFLLLLWWQDLQNAMLIAAIMGVTLLPLLLRRRLSVRMPYAFQIIAVVFVFAALYLGGRQKFYVMFPWWDSLLHFSSGLLLGILGFMLIYLLNEDRRIDLSVKPLFMAIFAFTFALALGVLWEILEFLMDVTLGTVMQTPTPGDPSGLTDTMIDLILDGIGAFIVAAYGFYFVRHGSRSFISDWITRFVNENPAWFRRRR